MNPGRLWHGAVLLLRALAVAAVLLPACVRAQTARDSTFEVPLAFAYEGVTPGMILARARGDSVYVPVVALFRKLQIGLELQNAYSARGYFLGDSADYALDVRTRSIRIAGRTLTFPARAALVIPPEIYLLPSVLKSAFGLEFTIDMRQLALSLQTEKRIPAAVEYERRIRERFADTGGSHGLPTPLRYPARRLGSGGGVLEYGLQAVSAGATRSATLDLSGGAELLGGDLQLTGSELSTDRARPELHGAWRFALPEQGLRPTHVELGEVAAEGLIPLDLVGLRISNEPWQIRSKLGVRRLVGLTEPGWEAEVRLDGSLLAVVPADSSGRITIDVPVHYGTSLVEFRYFGPQGQERTEQIRIETPFTILPQGTTEYTFAVGGPRSGTGSALQTSAALGLTDRTTARAGYDWRQDGDARVPWLSVSGQLTQGSLLTATIAPGNLVAADVTAVTVAGSSLQATLRRYAAGPLLLPNQLPTQLGLHAFLPMKLHLPLLLRVDADREWSSSLSRWNFNGSAAADFRSIRPSLAILHQGAGGVSAGSTLLEANVFAYGLPLPYRRRLGAALLSTTVDLDMATGHLTHSSATLRLPIRGGGGISGGVEWLGGATRATFGLDLITGIVRSSSSATLAREGSSVTSSLRGTVFYDPAEHGIWTSSRSGLGHGAADLRAFVDANGNGRFDPSEQLLPHAYARITPSVVVAPTHDGLLRATDLLPFNRYDIAVDGGSAENPLWIPEYDRFAFIAEPERVRTIDVPFTTSAVVQGSVTWGEKSRANGQAGLTVHIRGAAGGKTFTMDPATFSDGAYYQMGVPPGDYEVSPDPGQLRALGAVATPASRRITVPRGGDGVTLPDLDFRLRPLPIATSGDLSAQRPDDGNAVTRSERSQSAGADTAPTLRTDRTRAIPRAPHHTTTRRASPPLPSAGGPRSAPRPPARPQRGGSGRPAGAAAHRPEPQRAGTSRGTRSASRATSSGGSLMARNASTDAGGIYLNMVCHVRSIIYWLAPWSDSPPSVRSCKVHPRNTHGVSLMAPPLQEFPDMCGAPASARFEAGLSALAMSR